MFDMTEIIIGNVQTILSTVSSGNNLALCAIFISILSLCISFYNTIIMNKSSISVKLHAKYVFDDSTKTAHKEAEVIIINKSRRTKYINYIALTYSSLPDQKYFTVSEELKKVEPEEEVKILIHLERGYLQENKKPSSVKAIIRDTNGKKWKSKTRITYSELGTIVEQNSLEYFEKPFTFLHRRF